MGFIVHDKTLDNNNEELKVGCLIKDDYIENYSGKLVSLHKEVDKDNYKAIVVDAGGNILTFYRVGSSSWYPNLEVIK